MSEAFKPREVMVRVYVLKGFDLRPHSLSGNIDPCVKSERRSGSAGACFAPLDGPRGRRFRERSAVIGAMGRYVKVQLGSAVKSSRKQCVRHQRPTSSERPLICDWNVHIDGQSLPSLTMVVLLRCRAACAPVVWFSYVKHRGHGDHGISPDLFQRFEFATQLPGPAALKVSVYDHNFLLKDSLIGSTTIDLEDRWCDDDDDACMHASFLPRGMLPHATRRFPRAQTSPRAHC